MKAKSSAHYQREYRKRLREQGLVKKEVWVRPENAKLLLDVEKKLRDVMAPSEAGSFVDKGEKVMTATDWNTASLFEALTAHSIVESGAASVELIDGVDPSMHIVMKEYGDLPVFITVAGQQIIVESVLWSESEVVDVASFNDAVLRTHKYFPLSTISLDEVGSGKSYYHMFGALSSASLLDNVVLEIETLASNVIQATEAYSEFLNVAIEA